jgi:hypothetical protein
LLCSVAISLFLLILQTFVCENKVDHDNFWKEMEKQRLRINTADISNLGKMAGHNHPMLVQEVSVETSDRTRGVNQFFLTLAFLLLISSSAKQVQRLGFDDYLSNLVTAPEGVLNYLCHSSKLHMIVSSARSVQISRADTSSDRLISLSISLQPVTLDENRVDIQAVESSGKLARFVAGISISTVTKSSYGNRQAQTTTYEKAFYGTFSKVVDPSAKTNLEKQMLDNVNEIKKREAKTGELGKSLEKLYKKKDALKAERVSCEFGYAYSLQLAHRYFYLRYRPISSSNRTVGNGRKEERSRKASCRLGKGKGRSW